MDEKVWVAESGVREEGELELGVDGVAGRAEASGLFRAENVVALENWRPVVRKLGWGLAKG